MHDEMQRDEFGETWVRTAVEDGRLSEDAALGRPLSGVTAVRAVIWSSDRNANIEAMDKGYQVVHPRTMSREERSNLRDVGRNGIGKRALRQESGGRTGSPVQE